MRENELKDDTMNIRMFSAAGLMMALAGCTTVSNVATIPMMKANPVQDYWSGRSAGKFFAAYGPPISDHDDGGGRVYNWRGGYKKVRVETKTADGAPGKPARTVNLSCKADITTSSDYVIRSIRIVGDMPGVNGPSYCAELLIPTPPAAAS
ncbi:MULTISPECIES: hypothetical protein [Rhizobium]|uniref:Lipoprotein n=1 Tax=Rhizobium rhododendri TaxID=2506430 RepID=A0ABY8IJI9_9HYPH|nr:MULTISPECIES: hypothetical protein [Rhizobium]MBZ5761122.1 hypothetical protein [Rhizobium sp. VS19-DR96]MBZ5767190.1 hypothetical protein [Rhizobium sp. VS19-DR129.2]MBZ5773521.1 hypothetical protein [Rhizobium sp. VS19-DRK62.2]MBZ5785502.1 hypothetical protein [Rhizobium sp. VS19-DR121]MBZ5802323.1 hypothetical protein [Rhizobium sp. VS19-DR181]